MASTAAPAETDPNATKDEAPVKKSQLPKDYKKVAQLMAGKQGICSTTEGVKLKSAKCGVRRVEYTTGPRIVECMYHSSCWYSLLPLCSVVACAYTQRQSSACIS